MTRKQKPVQVPKYDKDKVFCEFCKGKPDYIYFTSKSGEILAIICQGCRDAFDATIKSVGKAFLGDCL